VHCKELVYASFPLPHLLLGMMKRPECQNTIRIVAACRMSCHCHIEGTSAARDQERQTLCTLLMRTTYEFWQARSLGCHTFRSRRGDCRIRHTSRGPSRSRERYLQHPNSVIPMKDVKEVTHTIAAAL